MVIWPLSSSISKYIDSIEYVTVSPSTSEAVTGSPTAVPASWFSSTLRLAVADANAGGVLSMTPMVTSMLSEPSPLLAVTVTVWLAIAS